jgi:pimeloyl-ACP methyl ester carboxylesterase
MASDLEALLDALGLQRAPIVGWSMGGFIAQRVAARSPQRVATMSLLSTDPGGPGAVVADRRAWAELTDSSGTPRTQATVQEEFLRIFNLTGKAENRGRRGFATRTSTSMGSRSGCRWSTPARSSSRNRRSATRLSPTPTSCPRWRAWRRPEERPRKLGGCRLLEVGPQTPPPAARLRTTSSSPTTTSSQAKTARHTRNRRTTSSASANPAGSWPSTTT